MSQEFLYLANEWLILGGSIALFLLAIKAGFRLGRRNRLSIGEHTKSQINTIQGAILGLLALLLGFTFAMAISRFEVRKQLVLDEANAIGTNYYQLSYDGSDTNCCVVADPNQWGYRQRFSRRSLSQQTWIPYRVPGCGARPSGAMAGTESGSAAAPKG